MNRRPRTGLRPGTAARAALIAIAAFLFVGLALHLGKRVIAGSRPSVAEVGSPAPDFTLQEVGTGKQVRLSSFRGKPLIVHFFCGCQLCRAAAIKWSEQKEKLAGVPMIAVEGDHDAYNPVAVKDFRWGTGWQWPILADVSTKVTMSYKSLACPRTWVIDANGILRHTNKSNTDPPTKIVGDAMAALAALKKG